MDRGLGERERERERETERDRDRDREGGVRVWMGAEGVEAGEGVRGCGGWRTGDVEVVTRLRSHFWRCLAPKGRQLCAESFLGSLELLPLPDSVAYCCF